ncbi:MAG TPA: DUF1840 domain-containing protein [Comamonas sp.]
MAYTFQSRATADLIMLKASAEQILKILDKPVGESGIFTVEQIPQVIATLEQAVAEDEQRRKALHEEAQSMIAQESAAAAAASAELGAVSLNQRAVPLIDMLRRSAAEGKPVTWKV